ncbi:hypothetical protein [Sediminitomix flava]|uniref:Uncharacterized protein n=1 Tax=Sediminitomix flava TaxID=379075 RepID=A0A315Z2R3_SEDFL|nr:hypothetical protein [Sediminitomix flava]PWJ36076.1 hypothetical protein BC781_10992 [Sediminitomix flava]
MWILIILSAVVFFFIIKKESQARWIKYGHFKESYDITVNGHEYYIEEVDFKKYNEALSKYFKVVEEISNYGKAIDMRYDLYDWGFSTFQFQDTLVDVRYFRSTQSVRLIKSKNPISIEEYEKDDLGYWMDIKHKK